MSPRPGSGGIPYTHREIFLASENSVGLGLNTFAKSNDPALDNPDLAGKNTFREIVEDLETLHYVRNKDVLWDELIQSQVVRSIAESEFTIEYLARRRTDIDPDFYQDVSQFIDYSNLMGVSRQTIRHILGVRLTHDAIWADTELYNRLLRDSEDWMDFFMNLTTRGNPVKNGRLDVETMLHLATHAVGNYGEDPYRVFSESNKVTQLLERSNGLDSGTQNVPYPREGFIRRRTNNKNFSFSTSTFSSGRWRSSSYSNSRAIALLDADEQIRKLIAQGRLGLNDPTFEFTDIFDGTALDNFWEFDWDYEFYTNARASSNLGRNDRNRRRYRATSDIETSDVLKLSANTAGRTNRNNNYQASPERARLGTHNFDVSNKNSITVEVSDGHTQSDSDTANWNDNRRRRRSRTVNANSNVKISVGNTSKNFGSGENPKTTTFDVSNADDARIDIDVRADSGSTRSGNRRYSADAQANASITISNIDIE